MTQRELDHPMVGWAVRRANGRVVVEISPVVTEADIWQIALGWPTREEVADEQRRGGRAFKCRVVEYACSECGWYPCRCDDDLRKEEVP